MDLLLEINRSAADTLRPHLNEISLAFVATFLVIFGDHVNGTLKRAVSSWIFIARVAAFVLMCTFGYGLLTLWGQPLVLWCLTHLDSTWRPIVVLFSFGLLGVLAERKRYM
ncbi:DUF3392 domain-containing protein [Marinomonas ostreistagni]|uniref:DUF3392 domain-containing protein n=1 Tax=Marinomonas ostreistagni TaxID=359209 RepID=UPI00194EBE60|nr:DUF3392 domain-containing protein [Marinomonas ostreistagni]MBM6552182.1 DUF3392 domain-containing protein [Marinomonas ostreistagni]